MSEGRRGDLLLFAAALLVRLAWVADLSRLPFFDLRRGTLSSTPGRRRGSPAAPRSEANSRTRAAPLPVPDGALLPTAGAAPPSPRSGSARRSSTRPTRFLLRRAGAALFGPPAGWTAGIAWAGTALAVFFSGDLVEATAAAFLADLALLLLLARPSPARDGLAGLSLAAALAPAAAGPPHDPDRRGVPSRAAPRREAMAVGRGAPRRRVDPARRLPRPQRRRLRRADPDLPYSGLNAYLGNRAGATGYLTFPSGVGLRNDMDLKEAARLYPEAAEGRALTEGEVSRFWWRETAREIGRDPGAWAALMVRKGRLFWASYEPPNHLDF